MNNLNKKFEDTIKSELQDIAIDSLDSGISSIIDDDLISKFPIFKYLYFVKKIKINVKEYFFIKKLTRFFNELATIPVEDRKKYFDEISDDKNTLSDHILLLIDRIDSIEKPEIIARLLKALIREDVDQDTFNRLCYVVDNTYIYDLFYLRDNIIKNKFTGYSGMNLSNSGLAVRYTYDGGTWNGENKTTNERNIGYRATDLGKLLVRIAL